VANHCDGKDTCDTVGLGLARSAKSEAQASTAGFVIGGVGIVGAVALWLTAGRTSSKPLATGFRVLPSVGATSAGVLADGEF
jgi:hypothetical protein